MLIKDGKVVLETPSGPMLTHTYEPKSGAEGEVYQERKYAGLIFWSAIFQVTPGIDRMARQIASHGYIVYVPEIWHNHLPQGHVFNAAQSEETDKANALKKLQKLEDWENDTKVLIKALRENPRCSGRIGTFGHCIGGHLALRAALNPEILCAAAFFPTDVHSGTLGVGDKADTLQRLGEIKGEFSFLWGRQDPHIPDAGRLKVYTALQQTKGKFTWFEFNANHTFLMDNDPKGRYDPDVSSICFQIILDMFHRLL